MTAHIPENTTAGAPAAAASHITVEGFDSHIPEIVELAAPRDGVPLVTNAENGLVLDAAKPARPGMRLQILTTGLGRVAPGPGTF